MSLWDWIRENELLVGMLGLGGAVLFISSLIALPVLVALMPEDYFIRISKGPLERRPRRKLLRVLKNLLGAVLVAGGLLMLVLPGQGLLTIVIGLGLIDFPGKRRLQLRLVAFPRVWNTIQWLRARVHHKPLLRPSSALRAAEGKPSNP